MKQAARKTRCLSLAGLFLYVSLTLGQIAPIRVPVRLVNVPAVVFSQRGQVLSDLEGKDFQVQDNGRLQHLTLDVDSSPVSVVVAIQANQDVRAYVPSVDRVGSLLEDSLVGEKGEIAVLTYGDDVTVLKPFANSNMRSAMEQIALDGNTHA